MQTKLIVCLMSGLGTFTSGIAYAQQSPALDPLSNAAGNALCQFTKLDKNRDEYISRKEASGNSALTKLFDTVDTNKDDKISREEARAFQAAHGTELKEQFVNKFRAADKDGDGSLTTEEAQAANMTTLAKNSDKIDANKDGKITLEEVHTAGMELKRRTGECK